MSTGLRGRKGKVGDKREESKQDPAGEERGTIKGNRVSREARKGARWWRGSGRK